MARTTRYPRTKTRHGIWRTLGLLFDGAMVVVSLASIAYIAAFFVPLEDLLPSEKIEAGPIISASFDNCNGRAKPFCVVDGDTVRIYGDKIRIADIDTPEVFSPKCPAEARLGHMATARMTALLNEGPFELGGYERDEDVYGRKLRILRRDGRSLGEVLVSEGLARKWDGARHGWC